MLTRDFYRFLAAIVALFGVTATANAQIQQPGYPVYGHDPIFDGADAEFIADDIGDYDLQVFTPLDFGEQSVKERFDNTGMFLTYDRAALWTSAPATSSIGGQSAPGFNYATWGNRYEIGYMTDNDSGFTATLMYTSGSTFLAGRSSVGTPLPMQVETGFTSFELNKTFRQPMKNGAIFEPYFGFRYMGLNDKTIQDGSVILTNPFFPTGTNNRFLQESQNAMPGAQLGFRMFRNTGRWTISTNAAAMAMYNNQTYFSSDIISRTNLENIVIERAEGNDEFVPAVEARFDLSYHLTRDIAVRAGGEVVYFVEGLSRANILPMALNPNSIQSGTPIFTPLNAPRDQFSVMAGFTFGLEWRR